MDFIRSEEIECAACENEAAEVLVEAGSDAGDLSGRAPQYAWRGFCRDCFVRWFAGQVNDQLQELAGELEERILDKAKNALRAPIPGLRASRTADLIATVNECRCTHPAHAGRCDSVVAAAELRGGHRMLCVHCASTPEHAAYLVGARV